jgi:hypothetical protein
MDIFHALPLVAVFILFVLLATDGQLRELYISLLESSTNTPARLAAVAAAFVAIGLISAVLYEAHFALSTMRINIIYSSYSNPSAKSKLYALQRSAAFILAFLPWLGLTLGELNARNFVAERYCQLRAHVDLIELEKMQFLWMPSGYTIGGALLFLGLAITYFSTVGEYNRIAQRIVACLAIPVGSSLFLLFTGSMYAGPWTAHWNATIAIIAVAAAIYFLTYQWLYRRRGGFIYSHLKSSIGISLRKRRRRRLVVWAVLPWFLLASYFVFRPVAVSAQVDNCPDSLVTTAALSGTSQWAIFPVAMCCTIAIGLVVGQLLSHLSTGHRRRWIIFILVAGLAAGLEAVSWLDSSTNVSIYRFIGPLGTVSLELLLLISTVAVLAILSQRSGFPALTLIIVTMAICVIFPNYAGLTAIALGASYVVFAAMAFVSGLIPAGLIALLLLIIGGLNLFEFNDKSHVQQNSSTDNPEVSTVRTAFLCWLDAKGITVTLTGEQKPSCPIRSGSASDTSPSGDANGKFPVFIVAAEGGGIYAASAISTFLAKLQDTEPRFAEHIFVISGVSGGAVGATIFQALDHAKHLDSSLKASRLPADPKCTEHTAANGELVGETLTEKVAEIMQGDHFSPVVGSIFPEIWGAPLRRPDALVASFEYSTSTQDPIAGRQLCLPFIQHWLATTGAPALVLNSTWVETGFRAAFAPFRLHDLDESLYSFFDTSMPDERSTRLVEAAGVSARFPLIMPPFSAALPDGRHWNFVDGAYSDNSGVTTALDLYRMLRDIAPPNVDLRMIVITSSNPQPNLTDKSINGTVFRDTIAPIDAMMKVREDLGNDAVARACSYVYDSDPKNRTGTHAPKSMAVSENCIDHAGSENGALQIVEIQDQTYGLPLGWKISRTSFAVVSWMLGEPKTCPPEKATVPSSKDQPTGKSEENENAQLTKTILQRNSCVLKLIIDLVTNSPASVPSP